MGLDEGAGFPHNEINFIPYKENVVRYIQFFQYSTGYVAGSIPPRFDPAHRRPIEVCGDQGIVRVDGRLSARSVVDLAVRTAKERGFIGYQILKGPSLLLAKPASRYWPISVREDKSSMSATHGA